MQKLQTPLRRLVLLAAAGLCLNPAYANSSAPASAPAANLEAALKPVLAGSWRSDKNKARDQYRHPAQTLAFFGVHPKAQVIEITPGGGAWYAEILAPLLKDQGVYIAANMSPAGLSERAAAYYKKSNEELKQKMAANPAVFGRAASLEFEQKKPNFGPQNSADFVLTFRNVHNWTMAGTDQAMFKAAFEVLKPGGVLGVVDHRAAKGKSLEEVKKSGYLPTEYVIELAAKAGFKLDASSEVNANPKDSKDYPGGVWTLPPSFGEGDKDRAKYAEIGESDRFTLRFIKPVYDK
ncbi:methyltransferase [Massilia sp. W12]|uniref:class I SAM-dependent methyltransferase n=1 Tax=Massilia sp. W12 TaxID=3126507 RepID=UPI0030CB1C7C